MRTKKRLDKLEKDAKELEERLQVVCEHSFKFDCVERDWAVPGIYSVNYVCTKCKYCKKVRPAGTNIKDVTALKQLNLL